MTKCPLPYTVSSPGKVILFGEHAVVYGKTALAASLDKRTQFNVQPASDMLISISMQSLCIERSWKISDFSFFPKDFNANQLNESILSAIEPLARGGDKMQTLALTIFLYLLLEILDDPPECGLVFTCTSSLPIGSGLGSSAAFSTALSTSLLLLKNGDLKCSAQIVYLYSFLAEKIAHGNPSGLDNTLALYGGFVKFSNGAFSSFKGSFPQSIIIDSQITRNAKQQVEKVKRILAESPHKQSVIDEIGNISEKAIAMLEYKSSVDFSLLSDLIKSNQKCLEELDVSFPFVNLVQEHAEQYGIVCKVTGAGGGGCILALSPDETSSLAFMRELNRLEISAFTANLGGSGTFIEFNNEIRNLS